jgi:hypothetical protein
LLNDSLDADMKQILFDISQEKEFTIDTRQSDIDPIPSDTVHQNKKHPRLKNMLRQIFH